VVEFLNALFFYFLGLLQKHREKKTFHLFVNNASIVPVHLRNAKLLLVQKRSASDLNLECRNTKAAIIVLERWMTV
jgi:hypothetical protein